MLRVLGCLCFPLTRPYNKHKLDLRSQPCIFIGYATSQKGYRCLHIPSNKIFISQNVQFDELTFPFKNFSSLPQDNTSDLSSFHFLRLGLLQPFTSSGPSPPSSNSFPSASTLPFSYSAHNPPTTSTSQAHYSPPPPATTSPLHDPASQLLLDPQLPNSRPHLASSPI
jgi:hypothetical protein